MDTQKSWFFVPIFSLMKRTIPWLTRLALWSLGYSSSDALECLLHGNFAVYAAPGKFIPKHPCAVPYPKLHEMVKVIYITGDPASRQILTRPINTNTSSEKLLLHVRGWIRDCLESHEECRALQTHFMPSILIEISRGSDALHARGFDVT